MTTYKTNNPLGSGAAKDIYDNAQNLDDAVNDQSNEEWEDRFGSSRKTWYGIQKEAERAMTSFGYVTMDSFEDGATISLPNQVLRWESNGEYYRWDGTIPKVVSSGSTPATSGGIGTGFWVAVGDAALRSNLASDDDSLGLSLVAFKQLPTGSVKRTALSKARETISFSDFGAKGDGVTDDSDALQLAFNVAKDYGSVHILGDEFSKYRFTRKIFVYAGTTLDLRGATMLRDFDTSDGGANSFGFLYTSTTDFGYGLTVMNGTFDNQGDVHQTQANIWEITYGKNLTWRNCVFLDVAGAHALDLGHVRDIMVDNCQFRGFKDWVGDRGFSDGIQLESSLIDNDIVNLKVSNCYFGPSDSLPSWATGVGNHGSYDGAPPCTGIKIYACTFDANSYAGVRGFSRWEDVDVSGCTFINFTQPAIIFTGRVVSSSIQETSRIVKIRGNTFKNCNGATVIVCLAPGATDTSVLGSRMFHRSWDVSGNHFETCSGTMIDMRWVNGLTVDGNTCDAGTGVFFRGDYVANTTINGNAVDTTKAIFYFLESDGTYKGTGLSKNASVNGNSAKNGTRAVHFNCLYSNFNVAGNSFSAISTAVLAADTGAKNGIFSNNTYAQAVGSELMVDVTGSCANILATYNQSPSANLVRNLATGLSVTDVIGSGSPEGVQRATLGSRYSDVTNGDLYIKKSGSNLNTGWVLK